MPYSLVIHLRDTKITWLYYEQIRVEQKGDIMELPNQIYLSCYNMISY